MRWRLLQNRPMIEAVQYLELRSQLWQAVRIEMADNTCYLM